ncbi:MAG: hypothetical protein ACLQU3_07795 [Limisphaerales bacterium]
MSESNIGEYKILVGSSDLLNTKVNQEIKAGFQPFGSPCFCNQQFAQAMVKPSSGAWTAEDIGYKPGM